MISSISCPRSPSNVVGACNLSLRYTADPFLCFIDGFEAFLFFALQMICTEPSEGLHHFSKDFQHFFNSIFSSQFFLCLKRWCLLFKPSHWKHGYFFAKGLSLSLLAYFVKFFVDHCPKVFPPLFVFVGELLVSQFFCLIFNIYKCLPFAHHTAWIFLVETTLFWGHWNTPFAFSYTMQGCFTQGRLLPAFNGKCF